MIVLVYDNCGWVKLKLVIGKDQESTSVLLLGKEDLESISVLLLTLTVCPNVMIRKRLFYNANACSTTPSTVSKPMR